MGLRTGPFFAAIVEARDENYGDESCQFTQVFNLLKFPIYSSFRIS